MFTPQGGSLQPGRRNGDTYAGAPVTLSGRAATRLAERFAEAAGVSSVEDLRRLPVEVLLKAQLELDGELPMAFLPSVDGVLFTRPPMDALRDGAAQGIPVVVGTNRDEWKLWAPADPHSRDLTDEGLRRRLARRLDGGVDEVIEVVTRERSARGEPTGPNDLWFAIETERFFRVPALRLADALVAHEPRTFVYLFTWGSPAMRGWLGACHGLEIAFALGTQGRPETAGFTGQGPDADGLAERMMKAWAGARPLARVRPPEPAHHGPRPRLQGGAGPHGRGAVRGRPSLLDPGAPPRPLAHWPSSARCGRRHGCWLLTLTTSPVM